MCRITKISFLQAALVFVWFLGVNGFPTIKDKKDSYSKITHQNTKQRELFNQLFSKLTKEVTVKLRSRRTVTAVFPSVPTNTESGILHCKTGNMLAIFTNGTVKGIYDTSSPYVKMELQSYNTSIIRIMAITSGLYLAMENNGRIVSTNRRDNQSLWIENHEMNGFITYQSYHMSYNYNCSSDCRWFLAIKNNGKIRNGNSTNVGMNSAQFQFQRST